MFFFVDFFVYFRKDNFISFHFIPRTYRNWMHTGRKSDAIHHFSIWSRYLQAWSLSLTEIHYLIILCKLSLPRIYIYTYGRRYIDLKLSWHVIYRERKYPGGSNIFNFNYIQKNSTFFVLQTRVIICSSVILTRHHGRYNFCHRYTQLELDIAAT